jgi:hypothetical protein
MNLKREFITVFHPYVKPGKKRPFRYKVVSINRLHEYIPQHRIDYYVAKMYFNGWERHKFNVQGKGTVYFYRK